MRALILFLVGLGVSTACTGVTTSAGPNGKADPDAATEAYTAPGRIVINEIMYAPVDENADTENHEFIEIYNRSDKTVALGGWTLESQKGVRYVFPADASITPRRYRVIAKNRALLARVTSYGLTESDLLGDYAGELGNGGDAVILSDGSGTAIDTVTYDDQFPWPMSADALGVGEEWLPDDQRPIARHQYRGRSLERVSTDFASSTPANWEASALDGATPGAGNSVAGTVVPIVEAYGAAADAGGGALIRRDQRVTIKATFSAFVSSASPSQVEVEYFVDDFVQTPPAPAKLAMTPGADGAYTAVLEPRLQVDNAVVRYRIHAVRGDRTGVVAPRATDPLQWFAYFVTPTVFVRPGVETKERTYHLFIRPADWTRVDAWSAAGRFLDNDLCKDNPDWGSTVPATLVSEGKVFDVRVRYEGSRGMRLNSAPIWTWPYPGPTLPAGKPLRSYSWRIKFPKYDRYEGKRRGLAFNKMGQGCPGTVSYVESKLLAKAGLPAYDVSFARLHINGGYYNYVAIPEDIDETFIGRVYPKEAVGDLFKDDGYAPGIVPAGDYRPITASTCQGKYKPADIYAATYPRVTYDYRPNDELVRLIIDLAAATKAGDAAVRAYFLKYWDWESMLTTLVIRNWAGSWDDVWHNSFPYKRPATGKWLFIQQDFDMDFGIGRTGFVPGLAPWNPNQTLYYGWKSPDPKVSWECELGLGPLWACNSNGKGFNAVKSAFIGAFKSEFDDKMRELTESPTGVLSTESVSAVIAEAIGKLSMDDWLAAPALKLCNALNRQQDLYTWTRLRNATVDRKLRSAGANMDASAPPDVNVPSPTIGPPIGEAGRAIDWAKCAGGDQPGVSAADFCDMYEKTCPFSSGDDKLYLTKADCLAKYKASRNAACRAGGLCFASYVDPVNKAARDNYCSWAAGAAERGDGPWELWGCPE